MGNLLSGTSPKEPTTVEECDSTWETDSGGEPEAEEGEGDRKQGETEAAADGPRQGEPEVEEEEEEEEEEHHQRQEEPDDGNNQGQGEPPLNGSRQEEEDAAAVAAVPGEEMEKAPEEGAEEAAEQSSGATEQILRPKRSFYAARDLYKYRHRYPNFKDPRCQNELWNLRFYLNKIPLKPDGVYIEEILNKWKGDYDKLEHNHTYIQWLFPLREQGLNFYAKELTAYEIEEFKKTKEAIRRLLLAYKMMLEFFGIKLMNKTGNVTRAANWQERYQHLNESQHNYLRITRILKSLGELGYEGFKPPLVKHFLEEALVENTIPNIKQSALEYFVYTIKERRERRKLLRFAQRHYQPPEYFIWGPPKKIKPEESNVSKKPVSPSCVRHSPVQMQKNLKDANCTPTLGSADCKTAEAKGGELCSQAGNASGGDTDENGTNGEKSENKNPSCEAEDGDDPPARRKSPSPSPSKEKENLTGGCENPATVEQEPSDEGNEQSAHSLSSNLKTSRETAELPLPE
ncbi:opioid growth factor receptor-like protein 1 isoform X2 [Rhinatrema bivittatum]|uniref:opioid growth factor receptor-like protein 1 isoform X2 n=1 Tax=Rhinatrema bivittatum TaxID=194408 RepID=UPI00112C2EF5|nr:opioid growth factor receptor-like protein 1 isoform X2 [Rhinatrema bivittatum]